MRFPCGNQLPFLKAERGAGFITSYQAASRFTRLGHLLYHSCDHTPRRLAACPLGDHPLSSRQSSASGEKSGHPMKILWISERFFPQRGGVANAAARQVAGLAESLERSWPQAHGRRFEVSVVTGAAAALPAEVVEPLGRTAVGARLQLQLLRCGNKLLLVSVTPAGVETLTEITDPDEVNHLAGLCRQARPGSASATFRQLFQQFAGERKEGRDE